ncbi:dynein-related ATPase [Aureococcus anophagefferens]|uniref:Dynein-related ATPase n=1 Tax=Aureococcus anophagefferens TaxID=44056 RepID=A0ABR1FL42_AURAN
MGLPDRPILAPALRAGDTVTIASTKTLAKMASDWDPAAGGPCRVLRVGAGGDAASPRLVDRNDLVRGDVVDQRRVGPLLYRASLELKCETRAAPAVCFVSCYGLVAERAVLLHGVEPSTASVSVYALGERELRALCAAGGDEPAAALLARWLGTEGSAATHKRRLSRADWTTRPRAAAPDFEDVGDVAVGAFAAEAYDRICAAAGDARGPATPPREPDLAQRPSTGRPRRPRARGALRRGGLGPRRAAGSPRGVADRAYADAVAAALETADRDEAAPVAGAGYADVRSAALAAVESDAIRRRKRLPPAASRPHAKHLVIEAKIGR